MAPCSQNNPHSVNNVIVEKGCRTELASPIALTSPWNATAWLADQEARLEQNSDGRRMMRSGRIGELRAPTP
jgi:hypothetical protein